MELTKHQTYLILFNNLKRKSFKKRFKFTTKYKWNCIKCGIIIYVSYKQYGRNSIFCENCYKSNPESTVIQLQYMRKLKEEQLKLIESQIKI
jgi:hypothetical protein